MQVSKKKRDRKDETNMEKIIEVKNLSKSYGQVHAVNDIDFYVETW